MVRQNTNEHTGFCGYKRERKTNANVIMKNCCMKTRNDKNYVNCGLMCDFAFFRNCFFTFDVVTDDMLISVSVGIIVRVLLQLSRCSKIKTATGQV